MAGKAAEGESSGTLIAVDAPPPEKCREFVQVAQLLAAADVHVPRVLEVDFEAGFMLVTDLGTASYLGALTEAQNADDPRRARALMRDALDALIRWQLTSREDVLPPFDEAFLRREMELMPEWFLGRHLGRGTDEKADEKVRGVLDRTFALLIASARAQPQVFMLRDFMPRNLMIAAEPNPVNPGVLDFQDAVYGPITYDVASLLRDAFLSWDEEFELDCFVYYWERAKKAGLPVDPDFGEFYRQIEWMGLQRHIKVLGLFCRINYRDGKPHYLEGSAAFHRLCAQGGRALCAAASVREAPRRRSKAARTKSATPSDAMTMSLKKAMIFAAGRGERMRPLTDTCPKPLLDVGGKPLIVWQIERLARAGFRDHRDQPRVARRADRSHARRRLALAASQLRYSAENEALETAGGIVQALPLLEDDGASASVRRGQRRRVLPTSITPR